MRAAQMHDEFGSETYHSLQCDKRIQACLIIGRVVLRNTGRFSHENYSCIIWITILYQMVYFRIITQNNYLIQTGTLKRCVYRILNKGLPSYKSHILVGDSP